ncbi:helix-turn-helix domain-containing protein [Streptomyces chiangmaiensis]
MTIGRLRRKLDSPPVITTTPTIGYRIADVTKAPASEAMEPSGVPEN